MHKKGSLLFDWMNSRGKQVIVFTNKLQMKYAYSEWQHVYENVFGNIDSSETIRERDESKDFARNECSFYLFNFFKDTISLSLTNRAFFIYNFN